MRASKRRLSRFVNKQSANASYKRLKRHVGTPCSAQPSLSEPVGRFRILSVSWLKRDGATWRVRREPPRRRNHSHDPPADNAASLHLVRGTRRQTSTLPAADVEGNVALAEYLRRGPVFLTMLRGLYCPFCRRHISQLRPTCEALRDAGVAVLGVVLASPERARQYFSRFPPCFPIAAAPDQRFIGHSVFRNSPGRPSSVRKQSVEQPTSSERWAKGPRPGKLARSS